MRRRYLLSRKWLFLDEKIGLVAYLCARGVVSIDGSKAERFPVGEIVAVDGDVVTVETTEDYEQRQHDVVGTPPRRRGRQDLDAVREEDAERIDAEMSRLLDTRLAARPRRLLTSSAIVQFRGDNLGGADIGRPVYALDSETVTAQGGPGTVPVGRLLRLNGDGTAMVEMVGVVAAPVDADQDIRAGAMVTTNYGQAVAAASAMPSAFLSIASTSTPDITLDTDPDRIRASVERIARAECDRLLGTAVRVDPQTGHILDAEVARIENEVTAALQRELVGDVRFVYNRTSPPSQPRGDIVGHAEALRLHPEPRIWSVASSALGRMAEAASVMFSGLAGVAGSTMRTAVEAARVREEQIIRAAFLSQSGPRFDTFTSLTYTNNTDLAEVRSASPTPLSVTRGQYTVLPLPADTEIIVPPTPTPPHICEAVEIAPSAPQRLLGDLMAWLGQEVDMGDNDLWQLNSDAAAAGHGVVYVPERKALRVAAQQELMRAEASAWKQVPLPP